MSGAFAFTLLTLVLRTLGDDHKVIDADGDGLPDDNRWFGMENLEVIDIFNETGDIKTFKLKRANGKPIPPYAPGQFLSFEIPNEEKVFRSYSVSGSPENHNYLQISIKKIKDGIGSNWFHSLKVGDTVKAHPPSGLFTDKDLDSNTHRVLVGGGVGITPLASIMRAAVDRGDKYPITLFFAARTHADLAFHEQFIDMQKRHSNITYVPVLSDEEGDDWQGRTGYVGIDVIKEYVSDLTSAKYFFCGPAPLTDSVTKALMENGVDEDSLHSEEFISPTSISEEDLPKTEAVLTFDGVDHKYSGKKNILEFFESQEVDIPFACRSGVCGACKVKCKSGEVLSLTDSGLSKQEKKDGYILTCVSWPKEKLELES